MKISLNWIKEFTNIELSIDELVEKIGAQLGAVEEVKYLGDKYQGILVVKVISCQPHPNADKLSVCKIDDGKVAENVTRDEQGLVELVCGAPNVHEGMLAAWIPPGGTVPSTLGKDGELVLEAKEIRGVVSNGMLASAHELDIYDDHTGIVEIEPDFKPGDKLIDVLKLDDHIIDIENKMFTHRPDLFGQLGIAREIAGIQGIQFKTPDWYLLAPQFESKNNTPLEVKVTDSNLVPRFMTVAMSNVTVKSSPLWLQSYLARLGIKPINNIVDVTNYVMILTAQPLHAYDADKLKSISGLQNLSLETRLSHKGEKINLLGGKELELQDETTVLITSGDKPVGIGGVMGGADTEVDENTKNIVLECANFDMYSIRRTAMQYGLFTEAVTRFIKGQSRLQNDKVMAHAMQLISELASGQQSSEVKDISKDLAHYNPVTVTNEFINARLGEKLSTDDMSKLLSNVEFEVEISNDELTVKPLFWRTDIEIPEDIVEEVGRLYGYDHLTLDLPKRMITPASQDSHMAVKNQVRDVLSSAGANELLTYTFVHGDLLDKVGQDKESAFQLSNALSPDLQYYRLSLIPSLLEKVHPNIKQGYREFALFEINPVHAKNFIDEDNLPKEDQRLALVFAADDKIAKQKYSGAPYYLAQKYLVNLLDTLGISYKIEPAANHEPKQPISQAAIAPFEKRRAAIVKTKGGEFIGELGEFRAAVGKNLKLPDFMAGFEIDTMQLAKLAGKSKQYIKIPRFPRVEQDITFKVNAELAFDALFDFVLREINEAADKNTTVKLIPLDVFQPDADKTHKHITLKLQIASYERTLTTETVNDILDRVVTAAKEKLDAERI